MKSKAIIISFLIIALIGAFKLKSHAQYPNKMNYVKTVKGSNIKAGSPVLIADETTLTYFKTEAIIVCDNETIFRKIHETHNLLFKRFTCNWKHTGKIPYKHYVIYLSKGDAELIVKWAKTNL
jgi:hypothetical protein